MSALHDAFISRSLLRALLRECTYLPDPASRTVIRNQAIRRFRSSKITDTPRPLSPDNEAQRQFLHERLTQKLREGRSALSVLARANAGDRSALFKVLLHTYGRTGKRRHDLLRPLLRPGALDQADVPENTESNRDAPSQWLPPWEQSLWPDLVGRPAKINGGSQLRYQISQRYPMLRALISSQIEVAPVDSPRPRLRSGSLVTPAVNIWARPTPRKLERRRVTEWYGGVLERLLPPLPSGEWERLKELAHGERQWEGLKKRRKSPAIKPDILSYNDLDMLVRCDETSGGLEYLRAECRQAGLSNQGTKDKLLESLALAKTSKHHLRDMWLANPPAVSHAFQDVLEDAAGIRHIPKRNIGANMRSHEQHNLTARSMRRLWSIVFTQCPKMDWSAERKTWRVTWGSLGSSKFSSEDITPQNPLFAGVDQNGKLPSEEQIAISEPHRTPSDAKPMTTDHWPHSYPLILEPWPTDNRRTKG